MNIISTIKNFFNATKAAKKSMEESLCPEVKFLRDLLAKVESGNMKLTVDGCVSSWNVFMTVTFRNPNNSCVVYEFNYDYDSSRWSRIYVWVAGSLEGYYDGTANKVYSELENIEGVNELLNELLKKAVAYRKEFNEREAQKRKKREEEAPMKAAELEEKKRIILAS